MQRIQEEMHIEIESALLLEDNPRARAGAADPQVAQVLYHHSPIPAAEPNRMRASRVGVMAPDPQEEEWIWQTTYSQGAKQLGEEIG